MNANICKTVAVRIVAALAALLLGVTVAEPALAGEHAVQRRLSPILPIDVHYAPGSHDGTGSWAWTPQGGGMGYHPNGWTVYAETPSNDAKLLRNLDVGDRVTFTDQIAGTYRIVAPEDVPPPWLMGPEYVTIGVTINRADGTTGFFGTYGRAIG